jgi:hypothetical protein
MEPEGALPRSQLSQINVVHALARFKTHFNIIFPTTPRSSKGSLSLSFPHQNPACTSPLPTRVKCPPHLIFLDLLPWIKFGKEYKS